MTEVSIIIPAYNRVELLVETIDSCVNQTFQGCEVIVVDDGSNEPLESIVQKYSAESSSKIVVRYLRQERRGANAARNLGLGHAQGQFIQFLDSDDLLHPRKIEIQKAILEAEPDIGMCYCLDEYFHSRPGDMDLLWNVPDLPFHLDRFIWKDPVWCTGSPLWRRSFLQSVGDWDEKLMCWQDWEFHVKALCRGLQYIYVPYILHYIREHTLPRSATLSSFEKYEESKRQAIQDAYEHLTSANFLTSQRSDALSANLLFSADELFQAGFKKNAETALNLAAEYAGGPLMKTLAVWMRRSFHTSLGGGLIGRVVRRLLRKRLYEHRGLWKMRKRKDTVVADIVNESAILSPEVMSGKNPAASVIIPTFNRCESLNLILKDLVNQDIQKDEFEILVIDNGSTDKTREVVEAACMQDGLKVEYVSEPVRGLHYARHSGARKAQGQILVYIDDDMRVGPDWLSAYVQEFRRRSFMIAAGGPIKPNWERPPDAWLQELIQDASFFPAYGLLNRGRKFLISPDGYFFGGNLAISRRILFDVGGFNPDQFEQVMLGDGESGLHRKLWKRGLHIGYIPQAESLHWIPASKMTLEYLLKWSKNWGAQNAYAEYSSKQLETSSMIFDLIKKWVWYLPRWIFVQLHHRKKLDSISIHRQMHLFSMKEQNRYVMRLILDGKLRRFVKYRDWLNNPVGGERIF
jgi:glycosyltransferase involved in cell wall biosynthesis